MSWFPGNEQKFNTFLNHRATTALARSYRDFAYDEMCAKPGPVGVVEARYHDIGTLWLRVHPIMPQQPRTGHSERKTKIQVGEE